MHFIINREVKHARLLSHRQTPEVNVSHAMVSQISKLIVSNCETILSNINVVASRQVVSEYTCVCNRVSVRAIIIKD